MNTQETRISITGTAYNKERAIQIFKPNNQKIEFAYDEWCDKTIEMSLTGCIEIPEMSIIIDINELQKVLQLLINKKNKPMKLIQLLHFIFRLGANGRKQRNKK